LQQRHAEADGGGDAGIQLGGHEDREVFRFAAGGMEAGLKHNAIWRISIGFLNIRKLAGGIPDYLEMVIPGTPILGRSVTVI
jgi:hypothetical protein